MSKQTTPPAPTASTVGPCPTVIQIVGRPGTGRDTKWGKGCGRDYPQFHSKSIPSHSQAEGRRLESSLNRSATENSPISIRLVPFSRLGKIMSEGWGRLGSGFHMMCPRYDGPLPPTDPPTDKPATH